MHCDLGDLCPGDAAVKAPLEVRGPERRAVGHPAGPVVGTVRYVAECSAADDAARSHSLDDTFVRQNGQTHDLRWIYLHMIEECARHNGHADLIRELVDGATGD